MREKKENPSKFNQLLLIYKVFIVSHFVYSTIQARNKSDSRPKEAWQNKNIFLFKHLVLFDLGRYA